MTYATHNKESNEQYHPPYLVGSTKPSAEQRTDYRRKIAYKHDGTTEDFEEKLHSLEHSQQKRMLNTAWKGETWFKVKKDARAPRPPITTSSKALPAPSQQQEKQPQQRRRYT